MKSTYSAMSAIAVVATIYAQPSTQPLLPGLPNDIAQLIPIYVAQTTQTVQQRLKTLQCLSRTSKQWHTLLQAYKPVTGGNLTIKQLPCMAMQVYPEEYLKHAIIDGKRDTVQYLCSLRHLNVNYLVRSPKVSQKMPLLAIAIQYTNDENDLFIIEQLVNAGANMDQEFDFTHLEFSFPSDNQVFLKRIRYTPATWPSQFKLFTKLKKVATTG